jgi:hypothetical protein
MKRIILAISIILAFSFASCTDDQKIDSNVCKATESIDNVPWIVDLKKSITNCQCENSIIKGTYNGQTAIFVAITDPACNSINTPTLYNCEGKEIRSFTSSTTDQKELRDSVTWDSVLYRCKA